MKHPPDDRRHREMRTALRQDISRRSRRDSGPHVFWKSLAMIGMVGWPIALGAVGGAMGGHYLDVHFDTGVHFTLMLLTIGVSLGSYAAWQAVKGKHE